MAFLYIFFADTHVTTFERIETQTITTFFAYIGGLLGLFLGVSLLSIIEFAYFATLRLYWTIRRSRTENNVVQIQRIPINCITINSFNGRKRK